MNIAFTGGGTGGHITPIQALIEYGLQDTEITRDCKLFRFGEANSMESKTANNFPQVTFIAIPAGKIRRYWTIQSTRHNLKDARKGIAGIGVAMKMLKKCKIDTLFCKGGYVALPVSIAAYILRIPIVTHESDTHAGMTNRLVARMSRTVFTGFPNSLPQERVIGQLLSPALLEPNASLITELAQKIGTKTAVLVMGGSQGAAALFDWLLAWIANNPQNNFHFLVILGSKNTATYQHMFENHTNVTAFGFIETPHDMAAVYSVSDVSITRGSATSLAEQHAFGIRKIIVPTPYTGGNHQRYNGLRYQNTYDDILIEQNDILNNELNQSLIPFEEFKKTLNIINKEQINIPLHTIRQSLTKK